MVAKAKKKDNNANTFFRARCWAAANDRLLAAGKPRHHQRCKKAMNFFSFPHLPTAWLSLCSTYVGGLSEKCASKNASTFEKTHLKKIRWMIAWAARMQTLHQQSPNVIWTLLEAPRLPEKPAIVFSGLKTYNCKRQGKIAMKRNVHVLWNRAATVSQYSDPLAHQAVRIASDQLS